MNTPLIECDGMRPRQRQICRGEAGLSLEKTNQYRAHWGLPPLGSVSQVVTPSPILPRAPAPPALTLLQQVTTFVSALKEHVKDGMVRCEQAEIEARLAICQSCPQFSGNHCGKCGCSCSGRSTFFNKLAWRSEKCPDGKWD